MKLLAAFFVMHAALAGKCIYERSEKLGSTLPGVFGVSIDDITILKDNWKVGMKISQIDYCVDTSNVLTGFQISIANQTDPNSSPTKLSQFGGLSSVCNSFKLEWDEYVMAIETRYNQLKFRVDSISLYTTKSRNFSAGISRERMQTRITFDSYEPFIGIRALQKGSDLQQLVVYVDKCTFVNGMPAVNLAPQLWNPNLIPTTPPISSGIGGVTAPTLGQVTG
jgi:hypothetical protein